MPIVVRRSKPLLVAPLIPLWALLGFYGVKQLDGSRFFIAFVYVWAFLLVALAGYVVRQAIQARKTRLGRATLPQTGGS